MLYKFGILLAQCLLATTARNSNDKHKTVCRARMDTHDNGISSSVCGWSHIFYRKRISFYPCIYGAFLFLPHLSQCTNPYSICSDPTYETWKVMEIGSSHTDQFHHVRQGTVLISMGKSLFLKCLLLNPDGEVLLYPIGFQIHCNQNMGNKNVRELCPCFCAKLPYKQNSLHSHN